MTDRISREDCAHVAQLALLSLTDAELDQFQGQLAAILEYAADIEALEIDDVAPTGHPAGLTNVLRADVPTPSVDRGAVLAAAPAVEDNLFRVPPALGEEP